MAIPPSALRKIPLFCNITDQHLEQLVAAFRPRRAAAGEVLFQAGSVPDRFLILTEGELTLSDGEQESFRLKPIAPVGELGALTRLERRLSAVAETPAELLEIRIDDLMQFFEDHGDVAFPFHSNLLSVVADKIRRDRRRLEEMRKNLITTQKAMKRMRDALLEGDDTPLHKTLFEELEALIEQNKRGHYLIEPAEALPTRVRLDDGQVVPVLALSKDWLHLPKPASQPRNGTHWSGVLMLPDQDLAISGTIGDGVAERLAIRLDPTIEDYARAIEDHLTRLQMLDVVL